MRNYIEVEIKCFQDSIFRKFKDFPLNFHWISNMNKGNFSPAVPAGVLKSDYVRASSLASYLDKSNPLAAAVQRQP